MRATSQINHVRGLTGLALVSLLGLSACATTAVEPVAMLPAELPAYVSVPHPDGSALGDLMGVFTEKGAPSPSAYAGCDKRFQELRVKTVSKEELERGVRELVRLDPVFYHWCFYTKLYEMEEGLRSDQYIDEKQKRVLDAYLFLTPVARGFLQEFSDSRYYRWAVVRYRKLSEYVFFRKLDLSAQTANELMGATSTLGVQRRDQEPQEVLEKYGLAPDAPPADGVSPEAQRAIQAALRGEEPASANSETSTANASGVVESASSTAAKNLDSAIEPSERVEPIVVHAKPDAVRVPAAAVPEAEAN